MAKNIDIEALSRLIKDTQEYIDSATTAKNTLLETIDTCGQVMGNDKIYQKQKPKLESSIESLSQGISAAAQMKSQLQAKWKELIQFEQELDS